MEQGGRGRSAGLDACCHMFQHFRNSIQLRNTSVGSVALREEQNRSTSFAMKTGHLSVYPYPYLPGNFATCQSGFCNPIISANGAILVPTFATRSLVRWLIDRPINLESRATSADCAADPGRPRAPGGLPMSAQRTTSIINSFWPHHVLHTPLPSLPST